MIWRITLGVLAVITFWHLLPWLVAIIVVLAAM
jgi:hypothetical protein